MTEELKGKINNLKLGTTQENFLTTTKEALSTIADDNEIQSANITKAQTTAENALRVATTQYLSVSYADIDAMITALETLPYSEALNKLGKGDLIITVDPNEPDFWIVEKKENFVTSNDKNTLINNNYLTTQFGYFVISKNNNDKVNIEGMVKADENLSANSIVIGADSTKKVKDSKIAITSTAPSPSSTDYTVPTSQAVSSAINNQITSVGSTLTGRINNIENGNTIVGKATKDANGNVITDTYATKDELANAGKVKSVSINKGTPVEPDTDGNIDLTISVSSESEPLESTLTKVPNSELANYDYYNGVNYVTYKAIKLEAKVVVTGVYNSQKQSIITQPIAVTESDVDYIYYLVATDGTEEAEYYYQTIEGNVVGGSGGNVLYEHHITFTSDPIEISSITISNGIDNNITYSRTAYVSNAKIVALLDRDVVTNTTLMDIGHSNGKKMIIHGYVTVKVSGFDNYSTICPIVSIERSKAIGGYRVTFVDNKILLSTNWIISELTTFNIPYDNVSLGFDLVTPIITK